MTTSAGFVFIGDYYIFFLLHSPLIGQFAHPHPQEDLPFFLSRTIPAITAATITSSTAQMSIVAIFSEIHAIIFLPPADLNYFVTLTFLVSFVDSL